jgi:PIN domain nuclease of toxin-antitoxin system
VKLLLDTQCWLWMQAEPARLRAEARDLLLDPGNDLFLSAASSWEIAIKYALGKLPLPEPPSTYVPSRLRSSGVMGFRSNTRTRCMSELCHRITEIHSIDC